MMIHEFEKLTGFHPTADLYKAIEHAYMEFDGDKTEFCKAYVENRDNLASGIARAVDAADQELALRVNSTIKELEKQNALLTKKLEAEQEWKPYEDTDNVAQADYEKLAGAGGTEEMPASQYATQLLLEGKTIKLYDIEDEDEQWGLDLQKLLKGIGKAMSQGYGIEDDVDEVLQLALFGELVYG